MTRSLAEQRLALAGPVGQLEALLRPVPTQTRPSRAALLCHPHPLHGGTMMNKTLYRIAKRLPLEAGVPTLRFNYRGAGASEGTHDGGVGEVEDTVAALSALGELYPEQPQVAVGYSFGAAVGLRAAARWPAVDLLIALGLPLSFDWDLQPLVVATQPLVVIQGERDEFGDANAVQGWLEQRKAPSTLLVVPGADHLFQGVEDRAVDHVVRTVADWNEG